MATATRSKKKVASPAIRPLHDKILVQRDEAQTMTDAGIVLPESSKDKPKTGVVLAVGDGKLNTETGDRIPMGISKGDRVIFSSYSGTDITLDGEDYLIMSADEVLAILD